MINSFFSNILNLFNTKTKQQKKEAEERNKRERKALAEWQDDEEKRNDLKAKKENNNLNEYIKEELENGINKENNIPHQQPRSGIRSRKKKAREI